MKKKYRNTFFDNGMVKTFLIQLFYSPMTSLTNNNVLNARPIFPYDLYSLTNSSQMASFLHVANGFEQRYICIPSCFNIIFYFIIIFIIFFFHRREQFL